MENHVFITGASMEIGHSTALAFAKKGVHIAVCEINEDEGKNTCDLIEKEGVMAKFIHCDVANPDLCMYVVKKTIYRNIWKTRLYLQ